MSFLTYNIDLNIWKVTLPISNLMEVKPLEILDSTDTDLLKKIMNDLTDGSLVFYTSPCASTANFSYSRTELQKLMNGGNDTVNWTFPKGGRMKGT